MRITDFPDSPDIESSTPEYARRFFGNLGLWFLTIQRRATEKAVFTLFGDRKGLSVLDVGGGHGQNLRWSYELGHSLTIVGSQHSDTSQIQTAIDSSQIKYVEASLLCLPFPDRSFDVVICYRILSHMHSWEALCSELVRVSNTLVLVDYPSKISINIFIKQLFSLKKQIEKNTRPYQLFSNMQILLTFKNIHCFRGFLYHQYFFPMALHRMLNIKALSVLLEKAVRILGLTFLFGSPVIAGFVCQEEIDTQNRR